VQHDLLAPRYEAWKTKNTVVWRVYNDKRADLEAYMPSRWSFFACTIFLLATVVACGNDTDTRAPDIGADREVDAAGTEVRAEPYVEFSPERPAEVVDPLPETLAADDVVSEAGELDGDDCPIAVIQIDEGAEVFLQTVLHLHGGESYAVSGEIVKYEWSVEQPYGSIGYLIPTSSFPSPIFEANVAGVYRFQLNVWDAAGRKSCEPALAEVFVCPCEAGIHIELTWDTPGDLDPYDEGPGAGTDLDLHFAHPKAAQCDVDGDGVKDPWFDKEWDTFWFDSGRPAEPPVPGEHDVSLDRDDSDGWGPENINGYMEDGTTYSFGVHYRDDHGYGSSLATVRVYVYSMLYFEVRDVLLVEGDLWWVGTIDWPSGQVQSKMTVEAGYWITPDYPVFPECP
jgi:hypothetical protein